VTATVYYANSAEGVPVTPVTFLNSSGSAADPSSISCVVTDPTGTSTTYTYNGSPPNNIVTRAGTGVFNLTLTGLTTSGLWTFVWIGTGASVNQVTPGTFRLMALTDTGTGMTQWYCSKEELKSRLSINPTSPDYTSFDFEIQMAIQTVTDWITSYTGRHFYQINEIRTYRPDNVWTLLIDDIVTATSVDLDYDGDGVYEVHWTENVNYQLRRYDYKYNAHNIGVARPRNYLQVTTGTTGNPLAGGQWLPWLWPFTPQNRVQITGVWGWPQVPPNVTMAALILAADLYKSKDAPWGVAGIGDMGMVKVQSNPWVVELLRPYINMQNKVGV
jgi:hypothetical protein